MWTRTKTRKLFTHPRLQIVEDDVKLPSGEMIQYLRFENTTDGVCIICVKGGKVLVQQEYSYPPDAILYQFPGGAIEKGEKPIEAARREVFEESGFKTSNLKDLGFFYLNNRRDKAKMYVFLATEGEEMTETYQDKEESITSEWMPVGTLQEMIAQGKMTNFSLLASWALYRAKDHSI